MWFGSLSAKAARMKLLNESKKMWLCSRLGLSEDDSGEVLILECFVFCLPFRSLAGRTVLWRHRLWEDWVKHWSEGATWSDMLTTMFFNNFGRRFLRRFLDISWESVWLITSNYTLITILYYIDSDIYKTWYDKICEKDSSFCICSIYHFSFCVLRAFPSINRI